MTFKAELKFNDSSFKHIVLECDYSFTQEIDITHKPSAKPKAGTIKPHVPRETRGETLFR